MSAGRKYVPGGYTEREALLVSSYGPYWTRDDEQELPDHESVPCTGMPCMDLELRQVFPSYERPVLCVREDELGRTFTFADRPGRADGPAPPVHRGQRVTRRLSPRAARAIKGACVKAAREGTPLRSFWTFTFAAEHRPAVASGELVPGREVRRVLKVLRERARRMGKPAPVFVWVAENPDGENPHVHALCSLVIPRKDFAEFCRYIEQVWGFGFVHLERIRHPYAAGQYILKAVNYVSKGAAEAEAGPVAGSRYGISTRIRVRELVAVLDGSEADAATLGDVVAGRVVRPKDALFQSLPMVTSYGVFRESGGLDGVIDELLPAMRSAVERWNDEETAAASALPGGDGTGAGHRSGGVAAGC